MNKDPNAYKTIGEVAKTLGLNSQKKKNDTNSYNKILGKRI